MKKILFKLLRFSGLPLLFREFIQKNKVSILVFHDIDKETAERTFSYLSRKYNVIGLNDFIKASQNNEGSAIPKKALIITFDDGHIRNYEMLPVIKKYNIPVTIFLCSSIISTNRHFWFKYNERPFSVSKLKEKSNKQRLAFLSQIGFEQDKEFDRPQALQKRHIEEMRELVNMQAHTVFHPILPKCTFKEAEKEILGSKEALKKNYDLDVNALAYPNGDYSERDIQICKDAGYSSALTVDFGYNTTKTDMFRLKRLSTNDTSDINELIVRSSGVWSFFKTRNGRIQDYGITTNVEN